MTCIKYIEDLKRELNILKEVKKYKDSEELNNTISKIENSLKVIMKNLEQMSVDSIEYRIYVNMLNGLSISRSIEKVAEENYINDTKPNNVKYIWRKNYNNLKKIIKNG